MGNGGGEGGKEWGCTFCGEVTVWVKKSRARWWRWSGDIFIGIGLPYVPSFAPKSDVAVASISYFLF